MKLWEQGDWAILKNTSDDVDGTGLCLRHLGCGERKGACSCSDDECYSCKTHVPDEIKGFFALVKWSR